MKTSVMQRWRVVLILLALLCLGGSPIVPYISPFMRTVLDDPDAATARATLGVGAGGGDMLKATYDADDDGDVDSVDTSVIAAANMGDSDHGDVAWAGNAASVEAMTVADAGFGTYYVGFFAADTGVNQPIYTDGALTYTQATGTLAATVFSGAGTSLTGVLLSGGTNNVNDTHIDWGAGANQVDADDVPESATNFWAASDGLGGNDTVKDTMVDWGNGAGQVDLADVPGGTAGASTFNFTGATVSLPSRTANHDHHFLFNLFDPDALYAVDHEICICPKTAAALTITNIEVTCDANPASELDFDLKFADAFIGLANATLIVAMDTTDGAASINAGFNDATVPSGKCIYVSFGADPDDDITQVNIDVTWDYD